MSLTLFIDPSQKFFLSNGLFFVIRLLTKFQVASFLSNTLELEILKKILLYSIIIGVVYFISSFLKLIS